MAIVFKLFCGDITFSFLRHSPVKTTIYQNCSFHNETPKSSQPQLCLKLIGCLLPGALLAFMYLSSLF